VPRPVSYDITSDKNWAMTQEMSEAVPAEDVVVSSHGSQDTDAAAHHEPEESVSEPGKVMRIGSMIKQLLEEVRQAPLDDKSRVRLKAVFERSVVELGSAMSPDLRAELDALALPFADDDIPSDSELRIAQAQLVGWLEGLFHGIQATLFAQQVAAQAQLEQMRQRGLPPGMLVDGRPGVPAADAGSVAQSSSGGTYL
jgi:Protein of unknown function (DUF2587)